MARRSVLLLVAALIALAGTAMIVLYVQGIDARATKDQELVEVLVATETIDTGETVADAQEAGKIEKAEVRRADLVDGSLSSTVVDLRPRRHRHDLPGRAAHRQEVRQPRRHPEPGDPGRQDGRLGRAHRLRARRRLRQPGQRGRHLRHRARPRRAPAGRQGAEARQLHADRPHPRARPRRRHDQRHLAHDRRARTATRRPRRSPAPSSRIAVTQDEAEKLIQADRTPSSTSRSSPTTPRSPTSPGAGLGDVYPELFRGAAAVTAVLEPDAAQRGILQAMLHGSAAFADLEGLDEHIRTAANEFAVVIGPSVPSEAAAELAQWARVHRPDLGVILLRHDVDSNALALALRSGMREVVAARDLAGITTAVQRARSVANAIGQTMHGRGAGRGGVGPRRGRRRGRRGGGRRPGRGRRARAARSSRSSPPRVASARASWRPTSAWRWPSSGRSRVPGRPRRQQRRRRDHAAADAAAHDQRPGRLQRRDRRRGHRVDPHPPLRQPLGRRGAGAARLPRPGLAWTTSASSSTRSGGWSTSSSSTRPASSTTTPCARSTGPT